MQFLFSILSILLIKSNISCNIPDAKSVNDVCYIFEPTKVVEKIPEVLPEVSASTSAIKTPKSDSRPRKRKRLAVEKNQQEPRFGIIYDKTQKQTYMIASYDLKIDKIFENIEAASLNQTYFTFSFEYLFIKETPKSFIKKNLMFTLEKEVILLKKIYRFFLLENGCFEENPNLFLTNNEQPTLTTLYLLYIDIFEGFNVWINTELKKLFSLSGPQRELKTVEENIIALENAYFFSFKDYSQSFSGTERYIFYSYDFIGYWRKSILSILEQKNSYIYLILTEFISFEIQLKEQIDYIRLKKGTYFLAIFKLKLLINDPIISKMQETYKNNCKKDLASNSYPKKSLKVFLKQKRKLRKKFMEILEIFSISFEHNIMYSMLFTLERIMYRFYLTREYYRGFFACYRMLNIISDVLFLIDKKDVNNIIMTIHRCFENTSILNLIANPISKFNYIIDNLDVSLKKKIMVLYIRILKYILDKKTDSLTKNQLGEKQFIILIIKNIEECSENNKIDVKLRNRKKGMEMCFNGNNLLLLESCLIQRIFQIIFRMKCYTNSKNWVEDLFHGKIS
ncbi:hypothetical protein CWI37_0188p0020 [Hamiltosporidium tvaerminnensis]|uniref:Uncharacterized protein n=1 Tax=Hamiltosporidium tvaerminnensis TaxID=1176355 RepID=A0A4Q9L9F3_9MICR|nr:hypothetical protein CWI37_0188p0020 [Hamiltosporidium tvaerminnensis]